MQSCADEPEDAYDFPVELGESELAVDDLLLEVSVLVAEGVDCGVDVEVARGSSRDTQLAVSSSPLAVFVLDEVLVPLELELSSSQSPSSSSPLPDVELELIQPSSSFELDPDASSQSSPSSLVHESSFLLLRFCNLVSP